MDKAQLSLRSKFHVLVPETLPKAERLAAVVARQSPAPLSDSKHAWGTCGLDDVIRVHWRLIQAPKVAFEYVVAHEVTHLVHRNHSPEFRHTLSLAMVNWQEAKVILERWELESRAV